MRAPKTSNDAFVVTYVPAAKLKPGGLIPTGEEIIHAGASARTPGRIFVSVIAQTGAIRGFELDPAKTVRIARPRARAVLRRSAR